jgi:hypothetical protein
MAAPKAQFTSDFQGFDTQDFENDKSVRTARTVESIRLGLTVLALVSSITILGTAGDTLATFNTTTLGAEYIISLWPNEFDIRPTTALVVCGAIVVVASAASLAASKVPSVSPYKPYLQRTVTDCGSTSFETSLSSTVQSPSSRPPFV